MKVRHLSILFSLIVGFLLIIELLSLVENGRILAEESSAGVHTVCNDGPPTCDFADIQPAVDAAVAGDVIKVAGGSYSGVNAIGGAKQLVYIDKAVNIKGGYDLSFNEPPDPLAYETRLDAQFQGRVFCIIGDFEVTLEGLTITGGDAFKAVENTDGRLCNEYDNYSSLEAGGGIAANGTTISVSNSIVMDNNARFGAGIFLMKGEGLIETNIIDQNLGQGVELPASSATLKGNVISQNKGGGISAPFAGIVVIENNIISGNYEGSGVALSVTKGEIISNSIYDNNADIPGGSGNGGGIKVEYKPDLEVLIADNLIESNNAHAGGGMDIGFGPTIVKGNVISGNMANFVSGVYITADRDIILDSNEIMYNETTFSNTIVEIYQSKGITLTANNISENKGIGLQVKNSEVLIENSAFSNNVGGGIAVSNSSVDSKVYLDNCTVSGNHGDYEGGGIRAGGYMNIVNSTIANNSAEVNGANLSIGYPEVFIANSIIANPVQQNCLINSYPLISLGYNVDDDGSCGLSAAGDLSNVDAGLAALADNGGNTLTHALVHDSPAIDHANETICPETDQRGIERPQDGNGDGVAQCDSGAYELWPLLITKEAPTQALAGELITYTLTVSNNSVENLTAVSIVDTLPENANYVSGGTLIGNEVSWLVPELMAGEQISRQFAVTATETITNSDYHVSSSEGFNSTGYLAVVTIIESPISCLVASNDSPTFIGNPTTFTAAVVEGNNVTYHWDFGDGENGQGQVVQHTYADMGMYTAVVSAANELSSAAAETYVTIENRKIYLPSIRRK